MKKAKIFLTAMTVLAVVGGALAFKVKQSFDYYTCNIPAKKCSIFATNTFETTFQGTVQRDYNVLNAFCDAQHPCQTLITESN